MRFQLLFAGLVLSAAASAQAPPDTLRPPVDGLITFGWSIDASDDWLLVGARERPPTSAQAADALSDPKGTVFVYRLGDGAPRLAGRLRADGIGNQDCFSWSMDVQGDRAAVGAPCEPGDGRTGAVYLYRYLDGEWIREAKIRAADLAGGPEGVDRFGSTVTLAGGHLVVGAARQVIVFERSAETWVRTATLVNSDAGDQPNDGFGYAATVVGGDTGTTILVGAPYDDGPDGAYARGSVRVFEQTVGGTWAEQATLICPGTGQVSFCGTMFGTGGGAAVVASSVGVYPLSRTAGGWSIGEALTPSGFQTYSTARWGPTILAMDRPVSDPPGPARHPVSVFTELDEGWAASVRFVPEVSQMTDFVVSVNSRTTFLGRPTMSSMATYVLAQPLRSTTGDAPSPAAARSGALVLAPNPTTGTTRVQFETSAPGPARLVVVDALGRRVVERDLGVLAAGPHDVRLDAGALPAGVYAVRVETLDGRAVRRLVRL